MKYRIIRRSVQFSSCLTWVWMANCVAVMTDMLHLYKFTISRRCQQAWTTTGFILRTQVYAVIGRLLSTHPKLSRWPTPIYAQLPSINTSTKRRLLGWHLPTFWSSADLETWMLNCHWLIARDPCVLRWFRWLFESALFWDHLSVRLHWKFSPTFKLFNWLPLNH